MTESAPKIAILRRVTCPLVNVGAKRSQDNKPRRVLAEACPDRFSRGCPLEPAIASQSPGDGMIPSLAVAFEAHSAPLIPARPFGLGWRFDEAPLVTPNRIAGASRQRYQAQPRSARRVARLANWCKGSCRTIAQYYFRMWAALPWIIFGMVIEGVCFAVMIAGQGRG